MCVTIALNDSGNRRNDDDDDDDDDTDDVDEMVITALLSFVDLSQPLLVYQSTKHYRRRVGSVYVYTGPSGHLTLPCAVTLPRDRCTARRACVVVGRKLLANRKLPVARQGAKRPLFIPQMVVS